MTRPANRARPRPFLAAALLASLGWQAWPAHSQVILSEVMADPAGSEHHEEFVELQNTGADSVDLSGWRLGDAEELDAIVDAGSGTRLAPGEFALVLDGSYGGNSAAYDSVRRWAGILTIEDRSFGRAGWSNSTPEVVLLRDARGGVADSFTYDPSEGIAGHSWERRDGEPPVWQASYLAGGTPGRANSVNRPAAAGGRIEIEAQPDPFGDRLELLCRLPAAPALLAVTVFDAEGRRVARLSHWRPAAIETRLAWDGRDARGRPVAPGLYVVFVQSSAGGRVVSGKRVVTRR